MQTISYANYDVAKMTPFQIVTLAKDELLRRDHTDYSILVFVLKGTVRVSTSVYVMDNVENGNMFVDHEHDYICVQGGGGISITFLLLRLIYGALQRPVSQAGN